MSTERQSRGPITHRGGDRERDTTERALRDRLTMGNLDLQEGGTDGR